MATTDNLKQIIENYKLFVRRTRNQDELYKWEAVEHFQQHWNNDDKDFTAMFFESFRKRQNLFYQNSWGFISKAVKYFPEEVRKMFSDLYSEGGSLNEKIAEFVRQSESLLPIIKKATGKKKINHQQDERTISVYLAFRYPEKYYIYKDSFYQWFCDISGASVSSTGEKYQHFVSLAEHFKKEFVLKDPELIELHNTVKPNINWDDTNLLVQNILFVNSFKATEGNKYVLVNLTWNSNDWQGISKDESNHKWVKEGNIPHESWNFDFDNPRNTEEIIRGFCQFTYPPKTGINKNLVIFYSRNQIVGFYGNAEILSEPVEINKEESYNLTGNRHLSILLRNKITFAKEKGYLEDKQRPGRIGFCYIEKDETIRSILQEAIFLNPSEEKLPKLFAWLKLAELPQPKHWVFQANPEKVYRITDALKDGLLISWMVNQYKKEINTGDKVILWVSGQNAGVYALATVTSPVYSSPADEIEHKYYIDKTKIEEGDGVNLRLDKNLINNPLLKEIVLSHPNLHDLKQGIQGTNFPATKIQYETLLNLINMDPSAMNELNLILFGPPGTGKTYHSIPYALNIINGFELKESYTKKEWEDLKKQFDDLREEGRIDFVTFHQSMSYEDFVEGIKPKMDQTSTEKIENLERLQYEIRDGVFKSIADRAAANEKISQQRDNYMLPSDVLSKIDLVNFGKIRFENWVPGNEVYEYCMANNLICIPYEIDYDFSDTVSEKQTEKTLTTNNLGWHEKVGIKTIKHWLKKSDIVFVTSAGKNIVKAVAQIVGDYFYNPESSISFSHFRKVKWLMKDINIPVESIYSTQFSSYGASLLYSDRVKKDFFKNQDKRENQKHVLIIDEINRGNIAAIFGELITLLEPSKRVGQSEHLKIKLPYSKTDFEVSANLHIIGTMNTADRSVEALDTALRRRFSFKEMIPKPELIKNEGSLKSTDGKIGDIDVVKLLETINNRLEKLIDKDHRIGHSYFMHIKSEPELKQAFKDKVIPLLEEYFFGDFGKIGLVLGSSFVQKNNDSEVFARFEEYGISTQDLAERPVFKIRQSNEWDFISIYQ